MSKSLTPMPQQVESKPIYSMTGFARISERVTDSVGFTLTLKSVNHRFLDLHMRMPPDTEAIEMRLRRLLKEKLVRGHVEVTLSIERARHESGGFDRALLATYIEAFRAAAAEQHLAQEPDLNMLFRLPGVLSSSVADEPVDMAALERAVLRNVDPVIAGLTAMREEEGATLCRELMAGMDRLSAVIAEIAQLREGVQRAYFERISQRVAALVNGAVDRDRVLQEAAILAERSDIEEETTRLRAHIRHFHSLLQAGGVIGKKLDFLLQEMNREANTLLSKTGGVSANGQRITELGLAIRSEIEKAREQVQNLE